MKTTLEIPDHLMRELKERAARDGTTMSELVEAALRNLLEQKPEAKELPPLPTWDGGGWPVDVDDRQALYDLFDADDPLIQEMRSWRRRGGRRVRR